MRALSFGAVLVGALTWVGAASAYSLECEAYGELHYAMAEAAGAWPDAAWEDAIELCEREQALAEIRALGGGRPMSYGRAMSEAATCSSPTSWAAHVTGGWLPVCGDELGHGVSSP